MNKSIHIEVEILRSQYDGKTLAVAINGLRFGPDFGPWTILKSYKGLLPIEEPKPHDRPCTDSACNTDGDPEPIRVIHLMLPGSPFCTICKTLVAEPHGWTNEEGIYKALPAGFVACRKIAPSEKTRNE